MNKTARRIRKVLRDATYCHAAMDGDCFWKLCPQIRDNEPEISGRHCPLDKRGDE